MPRFDGTGPDGLGPRSGRGCGPCNQDSQNSRIGLGRGRGYGRGRNFGCPFNIGNTIPKETEINILKNEAKLLKEELETIQKKLDSLKD